MPRFFQFILGPLVVFAIVSCTPGGPAPGSHGDSQQDGAEESTSEAAVAQASEGTRDWPQFRGSKRTNQSPDKGLLTTWPKDGPRLVWKAEGVGQGFSSVSVLGDRVYTMGNDGGAANIYALNRETGEMIWQARVGSPGGGGGYPGTRCTPATDGEFVYGLAASGDLGCVEASTGKVLWTRSFRKDYNGSWGNWEYSESPLIDGDRLVCTPGGRKATLACLDKKTGDVIWESPQGDQAGYASIVICTVGGVKQYVTLTGQGALGVAAKDGRFLWRYEKLGNNTANIPTPVVLGNQIFTTAGYGKGAALLSLKATGSGVIAREAYFTTDLNNKHGGVVVVGSNVYGDTDDRGQLYCADWKTGKVRWRKTGRIGRGSGSIALTYADGHLYVRYDNGWVSLVPTAARGYSEKGSFKIPNSSTNSWAHPVVIGGQLYLREKDVVWCYDVKSKG